MGQNDRVMNARRTASLFAVSLLMAVTVAMLLLNRQLSPGPRETTGNAPSLAQLKAVRKNKNPAVSTPTVVIQTNQFHWSSIESADYKAYVANLRSVGCPESTIRDIVLTDLMKYYAGRRGQTLTNGHEFKYWETDEKRKQTASQEAAREKEIARLDREVAAVVRELLGVNYDREINRYFVDTNADSERLRFLSDEKRDRIFALREKFEGLSEQIVDSTSTGTLSAAERQQLKKLDDERRQELAGLLSPAEREQYELTTSLLAGRLRDELIGFNPTESEFRRIFQLLDGHEEKFAFQDPADPAVAQRKDEDMKAVESEIASSLGAARYGDFQLAQNPDYRNLYKLAQRHELPGAVALAAHQIQQTAQQEKRRFLVLAGVPREDRSRALKAMRVETENAMRELLGYKAFQDYRSRSESQWLSDLEESAP